MEDNASCLVMKAIDLKKSLCAIVAEIDTYTYYRTAAHVVGAVCGVVGLMTVPITFGLSSAAVGAGAGLSLYAISQIVTRMMENKSFKTAASCWHYFDSELNRSGLRDEIGLEMMNSGNVNVRNLGEALLNKEIFVSAKEMFYVRIGARLLFTAKSFEEILSSLLQLGEKPSVHLNRFIEDELEGMINAIRAIAKRRNIQS